MNQYFDPTQFGRRLFAARLAMGMTQAMLSQASGISTRQICNYERGKDGRVEGIGAANLFILCSVLGVSADHLLGLS